MKRRLVFILVFAMALLFCGCCRSHEWVDASYTAPKTCSKCGETEGEALPLDFRGIPFGTSYSEVVEILKNEGIVFEDIYDETYGNGARIYKAYTEKGVVKVAGYYMKIEMSFVSLTNSDAPIEECVFYSATYTSNPITSAANWSGILEKLKGGLTEIYGEHTEGSTWGLNGSNNAHYKWKIGDYTIVLEGKYKPNYKGSEMTVSYTWNYRTDPVYKEAHPETAPTESTAPNYDGL